MSALIVLVPDHCISSYFSLYIMHSKDLLNYLLTLLAAKGGTLLFSVVINFTIYVSLMEQISCSPEAAGTKDPVQFGYTPSPVAVLSFLDSRKNHLFWFE